MAHIISFIWVNCEYKILKLLFKGILKEKKNGSLQQAKRHYALTIFSFQRRRPSQRQPQGIPASYTHHLSLSTGVRKMTECPPPLFFRSPINIIFKKFSSETTDNIQLVIFRLQLAYHSEFRTGNQDLICLCPGLANDYRFSRPTIHLKQCIPNRKVQMSYIDTRYLF